MDQQKQQLVDGWLTKASNHLTSAREHIRYCTQYSDSVQDSQACVELAVKAVLSILEIDFPKSHGWDEKQLRSIGEQVQARKLLAKLEDQFLDHIRLPRLLVLTNFWNQFYILAKYGIETGNLAPSQELFDRSEAELAIAHAEECLDKANKIRYAPESKLAAILA